MSITVVDGGRVMLDQQLLYLLLLLWEGIGTTERTKFAKAGISTFAVATGNITNGALLHL